MRFTILHVDVMQTPEVVAGRVHYVTSGSFTSHGVRLSESTVRWNLQFIIRKSNRLQMPK